MPLERPVLPMLIEEFHVMEHRLGWKHEYWDGAARLSCQPTAVASLRLELPTKTPSSRKCADGYKLRTVSAEDAPDLVELFVRTFDTAVEYAGWPHAEYVRDAHHSVDSFFLLVRPRPNEGAQRASWSIPSWHMMAGRWSPRS